MRIILYIMRLLKSGRLANYVLTWLLLALDQEQAMDGTGTGEDEDMTADDDQEMVYIL